MAKGNGKSLIRLRGNTYYESFTVRGRRFRQSLGTDDRETAEILAAKTRADALLGKIAEAKREMMLDVALGRYWIEHGQHLATAQNIKTRSERFLEKLGRTTFLSDITNERLADYVAERRLQVGNGSVNNDLRFLRTVINRAAHIWKVAKPSLNWKELLLEYDGERQYVLAINEEQKLFAALRDDCKPIVRCALATGLRLGNLLHLGWDQIKWDIGLIELRVKSKKPNRKLHYIPITDQLAKILDGERGNHPEFVFTYLCQKNHRSPQTGKWFLAGQRYPFTKSGLGGHWEIARKKAGLQSFRFHDLRHTAGTRALAKCGNLKTVQKLLGHSQIGTTARYAKTDLADVAAAMP